MTPAEFERALKRDLNAIARRSKKAVERTAYGAVRIIKRNVPVAFGELSDSVHADAHGIAIPATVVGAPHAAAVEVGSRPHFVPLEELIKWVKLRGMQGLSRKTKNQHAINIAAELKSRERNGSLDIDTPEDIARRIQAGILHNGTKPHWYVQASLPKIMELLDKNISKAFNGYVQKVEKK